MGQRQRTTAQAASSTRHPGYRDRLRRLRPLPRQREEGEAEEEMAVVVARCRHSRPHLEGALAAAVVAVSGGVQEIHSYAPHLPQLVEAEVAMRNPRILPAAVSMAVSMRVPYLSAFNARRIFVCDEATRRRAAHPKVTTMFRSFWTRSPPPLHRRFGSLSFEITDLKVVGRNGFPKDTADNGMSSRCRRIGRKG